MKKLMVGVVGAALALCAGAEYKVINLVNGTNDVQVNGAVLPIAIEVKSTNPDALVKVDRASDVDIFRKVYDVTTNDVSWDEMRITTNDYYRVQFGGVAPVAHLPDTYLESDTAYIRPSLICKAGDRLLAQMRNSSYGLDCFTNKYFKGDSTSLDFSNLPGRFDNIESVCYGNGVVVAQKTRCLAWSDDFAQFNLGYEGDGDYDHGGRYATNVLSAAFGNGKFVATAELGNEFFDNHKYFYLTSNDGKDWTIIDTPIGRKVTYCGGKFFAFGKTNRNESVRHILSSTDGIVWKDVMTVGADINSIAYGNGMYISAISGMACRRSDNGTDWVESTGDFVVTGATHVAYHEGLGAFFVGGSSQKMYTTTDGNNFTAFEGMENIDFDAEGDLIYAYALDANNRYYYVCAYEANANVMLPNESGEFSWEKKWSNDASEASVVLMRKIYSGNICGWKIHEYRIKSEEKEFSNDIMYQDRIEFDFPSDVYKSTAIRVPSRVTNYVHHTEYEYVTNRVYNVLDHHVTKVANIVNAQCVEGIRSQEITNKVYVINNDKLVVEGIVKDETESTDAVLIVK